MRYEKLDPSSNVILSYMYYYDALDDRTDADALMMVWFMKPYSFTSLAATM